MPPPTPLERDWRAVALPVVSVIAAVVLFEASLALIARPASSPEHMFWAYDPELGWVHKPGESGVFENPVAGFKARIELDERGARRAPGGPAGRAPTILIVGDSVTAGFEVEGGQTFSALLQERLAGQGVRVVNAGVRGYGTDQAYLLMKRLLPAVKPDVVLYEFTWNDLTDNVALKNKFRLFSKPAYVVDDAGALTLHNSPVTRFAPDHFEYVYFDQGLKRISGEGSARGPVPWLRHHSRVFAAAETLYHRHVVKPPAPGTDRIDPAYTARLLKALLARMKAEAPRLVVTAFASDPSGVSAKVPVIEKACRELGIEFADTRPDFLDGEPGYIFHNDGHWTAKGHRAAADALTRHFRARPVARRR